MIKKCCLIFGFVFLFFVSGCANSEIRIVVKELNKLYKIEILDYAQPIYCALEEYWDGDDYRGSFQLTVSAKDFMDSFPQVLFKYGLNEKDYYMYNGWLTWLNYSEMPDYEEKVNQAISMLNIFDVEEPDKMYICWYYSLAYNKWLILDTKNSIVYFREYTY